MTDKISALQEKLRLNPAQVFHRYSLAQAYYEGNQLNLACAEFEECLKAKQEDGIGAIVLGCGGMADLTPQISAAVGLPIVEGVTAAVKLAEALVGLGLQTSKHGDLDFPLPKPFTGRFAEYSNLTPD